MTGETHLIPVMDEYYNVAQAMGTSGDGHVVVGTNRREVPNQIFTSEPFYWTAETGPVRIVVPGGVDAGFAMGVSRDGGLIVGGYSGEGSHAFTWRPGDAIATVLPDLRSDGYSTAYDMNSSGDIIVGTSLAMDGLIHGVMWRDGQIVDLGMPAGMTQAHALDVSEDGGVIVGSLEGPDFGLGTAGIWTAATGWVRMNDYLEDLGVSFPSTIYLHSAEGISDDGRTITGDIGTGTHGAPSDFYQGWVAVIPTPGTFILFFTLILCPNARPVRMPGRPK